MARRSSTPTPDSTPEADTTSTEEAAVTADTTEATPEAPAEAAATKPAEVPINLDAYTAAVDAAFQAKDEANGVIAEGPLEAVTKAYRDLDGVKPKNAAKALIGDRLKDAVNSLDIVSGRAYMLIGEANTAGAGTKTEKAPADPAEAYVQRVVTLALAQSLVSVPEGVDGAAAAEKANAQLAELAPKAAEYLAWTVNEADDKGEEPEVNSTVKAAVKLATGKTAKAGGSRSGGGSTFDGPRRDIGKHIEEAFADKNSGDFLTIAEITNFKSSEYGDSKPSAGAISARLFPSTGKCSLTFVTPNTNEKGNRGASKN